MELRQSNRKRKQEMEAEGGRHGGRDAGAKQVKKVFLG